MFNDLNGAHLSNDTHNQASPAESPLPAERRSEAIPTAAARPQATSNGGAQCKRDTRSMISPAVLIPARPRRTPRPTSHSGGQDPNVDCRAHSGCDTHEPHSPAIDLDGDRAQSPIGTQPANSPVTAQIVHLYRLRCRLLLAETKLVLQGQALCRMWAEGDKKAAAVSWKNAQKCKCEPDLQIVLRTYLAAIELFQLERRPLDKRLEKLAKQSELLKLLPKGFGGR